MIHPSMPNGVFGAAQGFSPAHLPLNLWLDMADAPTVTVETGAAASIADKSGNGYVANQATANARPRVVQEATSGLDAFYFDGSNDFLTVPNFSGGDNKTIFIVQRTSDTGYITFSSGTNEFGLIAQKSSASTTVTNGLTGNNVLRIYKNGILQSFSTRNSVYEALRNDTCVVAYRGANLTNWDFLTLGYYSGTGFNAKGLICEIIICDDLTDDVFSAANQYLVNKWQAAETYMNTVDLLFWHDFSVAYSITHSAGAVSQVSDITSNEIHLTQSAGSAKPVTGTRNINGMNVLDFDGTDDFLAVGSGSYAVSTGDNTLVMVLMPDNVTSNMRPINGAMTPSSEDYGFFFANGANPKQMRALHGDLGVNDSAVNVTLSTTQPSVLVLRQSGGNVIGRVNGVQGASATAIVESLSSLFIGKSRHNNDYFNGVLCEVFATQTALTTGVIEDIEAGIIAKWGVNP